MEKTKNTDKMVEIARFQYPAEAHTLMAFLKAEGIECYLRNEYSTQINAGYDVGGARVEILEGDLQEALELMKDGGFDLSGGDEETPAFHSVSKWGNRIPWLKRFPLEKQILIMFILIAVLLGLLIFAGSQF